MISRQTEEVLNRAGRYAFEKRHEYCTLEHVLLSLLEDETTREVIDAIGGSIQDLKKALEDYLDKEVPKAKAFPKELSDKEGSESETQLPESMPDDSSEAQIDDVPDDVIEPPVATLGIQRLIQRAVFHVQSAGKDEVQPHDLFVALFQAKDSYALHLLTKHSIQRLDVLNYLSHGLRKVDESTHPVDEKEKPKKAIKGDVEVLTSYTQNLNEYAKAGKIDPIVGRQNELERMIQTLCRRRKNNPLLVGEAGVGKTALAEGLAQKIVLGEVPEILSKAEVYALDLGAMLAGAKFRGDFEQRLKRVLNALIQKKEQGAYPILFIDEIHTIIGAGAVSGGALDAANLLKPFLSRGEIRCIGSTTYNEFRSVFEKDHALSRRFQKIDIVESSIEDTIQILHGLKNRFEEHHEVSFTDQSLRAAAELSVKHLTDRFLPDKAIDLIDEAGAKARLAKKSIVDAEQIEEVVALIARIPARSVTLNQKNRLKSLDKDLKLTIFGQDVAIESIVTAIRLARSGLRAGDKPVGSFLFCGPTGVGKTELTKQLAHCLGVPFLRFDMSEYMEKHTVSRLIGAPPGYVGHEQAGLLTEAIRKNPYSVVLLDEIEKAHTDVWNILLQVMDHGTLTDNNGKKADFRNVVLIMTSNVGAREMERRPLGMTASQNSQATAQKEVERTFSPEFRNRLDSVIYFNPLDPITVAQVVGKQLMELESQLLAKNVEIEINAEVREWLAQKGYDRVMGARPLARLIQEKIRKPLSEEILFGKLEFGGKVQASLSNDELQFKIEATKKEMAEASKEL